VTRGRVAYPRELEPDQDQVRIVAKIIDSRHAAVQKSIEGAIPNVFA